MLKKGKVSNLASALTYANHQPELQLVQEQAEWLYMRIFPTVKLDGKY
ncbi:TPA: hypothetical protein ACX6SJ_002543 [Photobacterium damselae]